MGDLSKRAAALRQAADLLDAHADRLEKISPFSYAAIMGLSTLPSAVKAPVGMGIVAGRAGYHVGRLAATAGRNIYEGIKYAVRGGSRAAMRRLPNPNRSTMGAVHHAIGGAKSFISRVFRGMKASRRLDRISNQALGRAYRVGFGMAASRGAGPLEAVRIGNFAMTRHPAWGRMKYTLMGGIGGAIGAGGAGVYFGMKEAKQRKKEQKLAALYLNRRARARLRLQRMKSRKE